MDVKCIEDTCSFKDVKPVMVDLPYPPIRVSGKNPSYADLLSVDYCGAVSEMSAITQYINNENRLASQKCPMAQAFLSEHSVGVLQNAGGRYGGRESGHQSV